MHKCLKCGRMVSDISQISEGCTCGSKVFVFSRSSLDDIPKEALESSKNKPADSARPSITFLPSLSKAIGDFSSSVQSRNPFLSAPKNAKAGEKTEEKPALKKDEAPSAPPPPPKDGPFQPASLKKDEPAASPPPAGAMVLPPAAPSVPDSGFPPSEHGQQKLFAGSPLYDKSKAQAKHENLAVASSLISDEEDLDGPGEDYKEVWLAKGGVIGVVAGPAQPKAEDEPSGIENVRQLSRGVFEVNLSGLGERPLVVRDQEGVYYVRLPFEQGVPKKEGRK